MVWIARATSGARMRTAECQSRSALVGLPGVKSEAERPLLQIDPILRLLPEVSRRAVRLQLSRVKPKNTQLEQRRK